MRTVIENIPATRVAEELARSGIEPDRKVTIVVEESLSEVASRMRDEAARTGLTEEELADILEFKPGEFENIFGRPRRD